MSELNLIKTVLFNAQNLNEALTRLTELGIAYRACAFIDNGFVIDSSNTEVFEITIYPNPNSQRCPVAVSMDGHLFYYEDRIPFLAGQPEAVATQVPAGSPDTAGQRPVSLDTPALNRVVKIYPKLDVLRQVLRTERRLRNSQAKGLSS